jgi:hypothetical protein
MIANLFSSFSVCLAININVNVHHIKVTLDACCHLMA